jgi:O-acetyl-ADP-ribose deacetylase (regulator of RNase III)
MGRTGWLLEARIVLAPGRPDRAANPAKLVSMENLEVVEGDITRLDVDAIANAANDRLWMGAGVAGAIKRAGGDAIEREAVAQGPIALGDAVATSAGYLDASHVIHGAVMGQDLTTTSDLVRRTTQRCLEVAEELEARSLALPAFGTGVGGLPLGVCARTMVDVVRAFDAQSLERVVFAVYGADAERVFSRAVSDEGSTAP